MSLYPLSAHSASDSASLSALHLSLINFNQSRANHLKRPAYEDFSPTIPTSFGIITMKLLSTLIKSAPFAAIGFADAKFTRGSLYKTKEHADRHLDSKVLSSQCPDK